MIGARCRILGYTGEGLVVGIMTYLGDQNRYAVRYYAAGPQERWFTAGEISFDGPEVEGATATVPARVVDMMGRKVA